jgi:hypothetical protein
MSSQSLIINETNICIMNSSISKVLPVIVFLVSLLIFKYLFNKEEDHSKTIKIEKAKKYLDMYQKENEEFFFGDS